MVHLPWEVSFAAYFGMTPRFSVGSRVVTHWHHTGTVIQVVKVGVAFLVRVDCEDALMGEAILCGINYISPLTSE